MKDENEFTANNSFLVTDLITKATSFIGWTFVFLFIGHRSFGIPDFGITPLVLFATGLGGAFAIWCGIKIDNWR